MGEADNSLRRSVYQRRREGLLHALVAVWCVTVLAAHPRTGGWTLFRAPQNWAYDQALQHRKPLDASAIVIVGIDERSMMPSHLGRFPWPRRVYAQLLSRLRNARAVGFDIIFAEPDRADPASDAIFANAVKRHGRAVLAMHIARQVEISGQDKQQASAAELKFAFTPWIVRSAQVAMPVQNLAQAAAGVGFVDIQPDPDGIVRRFNLVLVDEDGRIYPHFAAEVARVAAGVSRDDFIRSLAERPVRIFGKLLASDGAGRVLVNYPGPSGTVEQFSFCDVIEGRTKPESFDGKIVLVGATAPGLYDVRPAPFAERAHFYLGVETNAAICRMLVEGNYLADSSRSAGWIVLGGLLATAAVLLVWLPSQSLIGVPAGLGILAIETGAFLAAFYGAGKVLPWGPAALATAIGWGWSAYRRLGVERSVIRDEFSAYVSPEVLAQLMRQPDVLERGERREVTLLFSDIRGSTSLAERMPPEQWIAQLNEYLTAMADVILAADGYLDKFMGDGIMAIWNTFGDQPHHADLGVVAARAMLERLEGLNREWAARPDRCPLRIGIGLHTGEAIVGNVGSAQRTQFTAIGDTVNAAARVEEATKALRVPLVVSEATVQKLTTPQSDLVELGEVALRGRTEPVRVYGLTVSREVMHSVAQTQDEAEDPGGTPCPDA
ncbi:MAG: adenylate/guanylate cyclase domain-containing protein [Armatimonadetes bacterium]|nr:adenylate/guanylate cyclase domain-containing protein [Armatimonadota bacterium]